MQTLNDAVNLLLLDDEPSSAGPDGHLPEKTRKDCLERVWQAFKEKLREIPS